MKWQHKALLQRWIAGLPAAWGDRLYYFLQRRAGADQLGLKNANPLGHFQAGVTIAELLRRRNISLRDRLCLELGTGRHLPIPIALWLCGARGTCTVDLNPLLREDLVLEELAYARQHPDAVQAVFAGHCDPALFAERWRRLRDAAPRLESVMTLAGIEYLAPADAACLPLPDASVDVHLSHTVLEHIDPAVLPAILREAQRVLKPGGLLVHRIGFLDHYSYTDPTITSVNFLRYSDAQWEALAGNRFACHNRLRGDEFERIFAAAGLTLLEQDRELDPAAAEAIRRGFPLDARFRGRDPDMLACANAWWVAAPGAGLG